MKTLKEKFEEILDETCVGGCDNGRHNHSKPAIKALIQAVQVYNKEVMGNKHDLDCDISKPWVASCTCTYHEKYKEIKKRQEELLG